MNDEIAAVRSHAELIVGDLLRRTLTIYDKELSSSVDETNITNTKPEMDSIGDQTLMIERNNGGDSNNTKEIKNHAEYVTGSRTPRTEIEASCVDTGCVVSIIEKIKADTARLSNTLKLFNKHKTLPAIAERSSEEK